MIETLAWRGPHLRGVFHVARIEFYPTSRENAPIFACRAENQSSRRGARCASSTHSPCPRRTPARAAPHWSLPATSTRGGSATSGSTPMRPPGVHLAHSGRWLLPAARMLRIQPFFRDSSTPSTHRTTHLIQLSTQKLLRRESKSGTWQVNADPARDDSADPIFRPQVKAAG